MVLTASSFRTGRRARIFETRPRWRWASSNVSKPSGGLHHDRRGAHGLLEALILSCMMSGVLSIGKRACVAAKGHMPSSSVLGSSRIDLAFKNISAWLALRSRSVERWTVTVTFHLS